MMESWERAEAVGLDKKGSSCKEGIEGAQGKGKGLEEIESFEEET